MTDRTTRVLVGILAPCALLVTGLVVRREVFLRPASPVVNLTRYVPGWRAWAHAGHRIGLAGAPVTILEFGDFECGFCAEFDSLYSLLKRDFGDSVSLVYRHYPLPFHQHAFVAAIAAECAALEGRFWAMHDSLTGARMQMGGRSWVSLAVAAGVADTSAFLRCIRSDSAAAIVRRDRDAVRQLGSPGTPTLIINGDVLLGTPSYEELRANVSRHLSEARHAAAGRD